MKRVFVAGALLLVACGPAHHPQREPDPHESLATWVPADGAVHTKAEWDDELRVVGRRLTRYDVPAEGIEEKNGALVVRLHRVEADYRGLVDRMIAMDRKLTIVAVNEAGAPDPAAASLTPMLLRAQPAQQPDASWILDLELSPDSARAFDEIAGRLAGKTLAFLLDDEELARVPAAKAAPGGKIRIPFDGKGSTSGEKTRYRLHTSIAIACANLPFALKPAP